LQHSGIIPGQVSVPRQHGPPFLDIMFRIISFMLVKQQEDLMLWSVSLLAIEITSSPYSLGICAQVKKSKTWTLDLLLRRNEGEEGYRDMRVVFRQKRKWPRWGPFVGKSGISDNRRVQLTLFFQKSPGSVPRDEGFVLHTSAGSGTTHHSTHTPSHQEKA